MLVTSFATERKCCETCKNVYAHAAMPAALNAAMPAALYASMHAAMPAALNAAMPAADSSSA